MGAAHRERSGTGRFKMRIRNIVLPFIATVVAACNGEPDDEGVTRAEDGLGIPKTSYPFPADAIFVATTGNDANTGTEALPLRTLAGAYQKAVSGKLNTIVLRGGEYRESLPS